MSWIRSVDRPNDGLCLTPQLFNSGGLHPFWFHLCDGISSRQSSSFWMCLPVNQRFVAASAWQPLTTASLSMSLPVAVILLLRKCFQKKHFYIFRRLVFCREARLIIHKNSLTGRGPTHDSLDDDNVDDDKPQTKRVTGCALCGATGEVSVEPAPSIDRPE